MSRPNRLRIPSRRTMACHRISMPKRTMYQPFCKQISHPTQRVIQLFLGLCRKSIHQIGMHHYSILRQIAHTLRCTLYRNSLIYQFQHSRRCHLQSARHCYTSRFGQQITQFCRVSLIKTHIGPIRYNQFSL